MHIRLFCLTAGFALLLSACDPGDQDNRSASTQRTDEQVYIAACQKDDDATEGYCTCIHTAMKTNVSEPVYKKIVQRMRDDELSRVDAEDSLSPEEFQELAPLYEVLFDCASD